MMLQFAISYSTRTEPSPANGFVRFTEFFLLYVPNAVLDRVRYVAALVPVARAHPPSVSARMPLGERP